MSADPLFGPAVSRWAIAQSLLDEIRAWMPEYLAAFERQHRMDLGRTQAPNSYRVRHAGIVASTDTLPAVIVWVAGVTDRRDDPDSGIVTGTVQLGVRVAASSSVADATGELLHRYVAAINAMLLDRSTAGGLAGHLEVVDEDYTGIDPSDAQNTLQAGDLECEAFGVVLGQRHAGPGEHARPRPDPTGEWPGAPISHHVVEHLEIDVIDPNDVD